MNNLFFKIKSNTLQFFYEQLIKRIFFLNDPEKVHDRISNVAQFFGHHKISKKITKLLFNYQHPSLKQKILGIKFENPIGLSAGFDKNAELTDIMPEVGFGFMEVGSITGEPCKGNAKPRLWRLPKSQALIVHYGLKNGGCKKIAQRIQNKKFKIPVGISIAKTNCEKTVSTEEGIKDYLKAYKAFKNIGQYITINVSCPNAYGGQPFTDPKKLEKLLSEISKLPKNKPIFLKLSPDITETQLNSIIKIAQKNKIDGFICSNLTKNRHNKKILDKKIPKIGGISGKVVEDLANKLISHVYRKTKGKMIIIGCGGVFSAEDAYKKIRLGASLIQIITGMIFKGPQLIGQINEGLSELIKKDGFKNISAAIGADQK